MIETIVSFFILLVTAIFLLWLFSDEHCDKEIRKMIERNLKDEQSR